MGGVDEAVEAVQAAGEVAPVEGEATGAGLFRRRRATKGKKASRYSRRPSRGYLY